MIEDITIAERQRIDAIAQEYLAKGYEVSRGVPLDFFPSFRADIVARKGDEVKVIEVKAQTSMERNPSTGEMLEILYSKPGWTYQLNLVGERGKLRSPEDARPYISLDIRRHIEESERLLRLGFTEAAFLIAWSASVAVLRTLIEEHGITVKRVTNSAYIVDLAVIEGVISREDYEYLNDVMKHRNAVAHGFSVSGVNDEFVVNLLEVIQRLSLESSDQSIE